MLNINPEPRSKMPTKFKPTQKTVARGTGKVSVTHYYMKSTPLKELIEEYNRILTQRGKGKLRQKIANEFVRRRKNGLPFATLTGTVDEN
jgi:hypothetical protein